MQLPVLKIYTVQGSVCFAFNGKIAFTSILPKMMSWVLKLHFVLDCHHFSIAQWIRAQRIMGSAALVLGSILVAALFHFDGFSSDWFDSDDQGLTIEFVKTLE